MSAPARLAVLGGTFDPVHYGHLDAGTAAQRALGVPAVRLLPAHDPPHRPAEPHASGFHRFALAALAIDGRDGWHVSDLELTRPGPSYTIDTLRALHQEGWTPAQIVFVVGADAFAEIGTWREFPAVLDAAHFAVVARPGSTLEAAAARTPAVAPRLHRLGPGETAPAATLDAPRVFLIEARTRDVSSTTIRSRLAAGLALDGLVPPGVARHILAHHLYSPVGELHGEEQRSQR